MKALLALSVLALTLSSCGTGVRAPSASETAPLPSIVSRSTWGAEPPNETLLDPMGPVRFITIHQTETPYPDSIDEPARLRSIQRSHQVVDRTWGDIAYHYLIGPSGTIYEARSERFAASSGTVYLTPAQWEEAGQNDLGQTTAPIPMGPDGQPLEPSGATAGHLTISLIGTYHTTLPTPAARAALIELTVAKLHEYGLHPEAVHTHREVAVPTDCPGQRLYDWLRGDSRQRDGRGEGLRLIDAAFAHLGDLD